MTKFFIVVPPGFERVAYYELVRHLKSQESVFENISDTKVEHFTGGMEVELPYLVGLALNHALKVPTRILLRIGSREVLHIKDYIQFIKSINWAKFDRIHKVYATSRTSKLKIKGNLEEILEKTVRDETSKKPKTPKSSSQGIDVYVRFFRDECTLSIDTSGEDLYRRGYDKWTGEAPLRDNMAAGLLQFALQGAEDLSQWQVIDPMLGSGTFLLEAAYSNKMFERSFSYQSWNLSAEEKARLAEIIKHFYVVKNHTGDISPQVLGFDRDPKMVDTAQRNLAELKLPKENVHQADVLKDDKKWLSGHGADLKRLVIVNPPYGKRLKISERDLFIKILDRVAEKFNPDRICMIVPPSLDLQHDNYESVRILEFSNNGIDLRFFLFLKIK